MRFVFIFIAAFFIAASAGAQEKLSIFKTHDTLQEVTIHSQSVQRVLKSAREYVVDYDFVDGYILVASYSGSSRKNFKLFLLTKLGDTAAILHLPEQVVKLFKGTNDHLYCITDRAMYPLETDSGRLHITMAYDLSIYNSMRNCLFSINDQYYYKISDWFNFSLKCVRYLLKDSGKATPIFESNDEQARTATWKTIQTVQTLKILAKVAADSGNMQRAIELGYQGDELAGRTVVMNGNAYRYLDRPLFADVDKIRLFDFRKKQIESYDPDGNLLESIPLHLSFTNVQRLEVLKDPVTNEYYLHRSDNMEAQTIARINMQTGEIRTAIPIEKPFISKLKVFDGEIYYLYQNPKEPGTQQLYVQKGF